MMMMVIKEIFHKTFVNKQIQIILLLIFTSCAMEQMIKAYSIKSFL